MVQFPLHKDVLKGGRKKMARMDGVPAIVTDASGHWLDYAGARWSVLATQRARK